MATEHHHVAMATETLCYVTVRLTKDQKLGAQNLRSCVYFLAAN